MITKRDSQTYNDINIFFYINRYITLKRRKCVREMKRCIQHRGRILTIIDDPISYTIDHVRDCDYKTCSICKNTYTTYCNLCKHILCVTCGLRIMKSNTIPCPLCMMSRIYHVKHDVILHN